MQDNQFLTENNVEWIIPSPLKANPELTKLFTKAYTDFHILIE